MKHQAHKAALLSQARVSQAQLSLMRKGSGRRALFRTRPKTAAMAFALPLIAMAAMFVTSI